MKKYFVIQIYNVMNPDVIFQTDVRSDATAYCDIMRRNNPKNKYIVGTIFAD